MLGPHRPLNPAVARPNSFQKRQPVGRPDDARQNHPDRCITPGRAPAAIARIRSTARKRVFGFAS